MLQQEIHTCCAVMECGALHHLNANLLNQNSYCGRCAYLTNQALILLSNELHNQIYTYIQQLVSYIFIVNVWHHLMFVTFDMHCIMDIYRLFISSCQPSNNGHDSSGNHSFQVLIQLIFHSTWTKLHLDYISMSKYAKIHKRYVI